MKGSLVLFLVVVGICSAACLVDAEGLRIGPVKGRVGCSNERGNYCQLEGGLEWELGWLSAEIDGRYDWPEYDQKLQLVFDGMTTGDWDWQIKGYVGCEERYDLGEGGFFLGYEWGPVELRLNGKNYLKTMRVTKGQNFGREDIYTRISGDWNGENGQRLHGEIVFYDKDYQKRVDYTSDKRSGKLEYQFYSGKNKYTLTYTESSGDYPYSVLKNYFSNGFAVKWQLSQANRRKWEVKAAYQSTKKGDGTVPESISLDLARTRPLGPGDLRCRLHRRWKGDVDWAESFTPEEEEGVGTGYQSFDIRWKWRLGHKNAWWIGGEVKDYDDGFLSWKLNTQRDWKLGNLFFQLNLFYNHNKDGKNAGSWLQTTYYFR